MTKTKFKSLGLPAVAISYLRDIKGWSYEEIGRRLKCDKATIWRAHTQGSEPMKHTVKALKRLAERIWKAENK